MLSQYVRYRMVSITVCLASLVCLPINAQEPAPAPTDVPMVLHIGANEVVLDVVARDQHHNPVNDLAEGDFQVFEVGKHADKNPHRILSLRAIDPHKDASRAGASDSGFRISTGAICALNATTHYEIAIQAATEPGYHQVLVKTTRPGVTLSFRHHYYVGLNPDDAHVKNKKAASDDIALGEAACFHPLIPPTLAVSAHPIVVAGRKSTAYAVAVRPESFAGIGLNGTDTHVQLDFGLCTFDATGNFAQYLHSSVDKELDAAAMEKAQARGLVNLLEIPGDKPPDLARLVVRDRVTGNMGIVDVARPLSLAAQGDSGKKLERPVGSVRAFGSVTPRENTFCGDVYELSSGASALPEFWNLEPVGSIYTDTLNVVDQDMTKSEGIPGVTRSAMWFGVDYYGEFYITQPGDYVFEVESDDGSRVEIDNQQIIEVDGLHPAQARSAHIALAAGRHAIHIPYFQGSPPGLALMLRIKPPGGGMKLFNLGEFAAPGGAEGATASH